MLIHLVSYTLSGEICPDTVNVDKAISLEEMQMKDYEATWPEGFHAKKVITMATTKKHVKVGSACVFDTELIYSTVMCMINSHDLDMGMYSAMS